jgi:DnaK suppressor protein
MTNDSFKGFAPYQPKAAEEYMSDPQEKHFRAILTSWKEQLLEEVNVTVRHLRDEHVNLPDAVDQASQEEEFALELRARDRDRKLLRKIEGALNRLKSGDYGYCESCGMEIGIRRLEARPTAELCIDCKQLEEQREKGGRFKAMDHED